MAPAPPAPFVFCNHNDTEVDDWCEHRHGPPGPANCHWDDDANILWLASSLSVGVSFFL